jgi:uncharacterized protein YjbI with pentapeptide repeats
MTIKSSGQNNTITDGAFTNTTLINVTIKDSKISSSSIINSIISDSTFAHCKFVNCTISNCRFASCVFANCAITNDEKPVPVDQIVATLSKVESTEESEPKESENTASITS